MRIERLAVHDFRKLVGGVAIDGLVPGLNVIVGDNEEGKSTLLKALQAAFFDRHRLGGRAIDEMTPFGAQGARPRVEVGFEMNGTGYRLSKAFARNPEASLEGGGERWQGEAAEDRLRELLGFSHPGRGAAREEHRGLAGLLWVEQGRAFAPLAMNADSRNALREAIEGEVGQVLGGDRGRRLLDAVADRAGRYYTRTGREREALNEPRKRLAAIEEECGALDAALREYDGKVDRLEGLRARLARRERDGSLAVAKGEAERADDAARRLETISGKVDTARARRDQARTEANAARDEKERRARLAAEAAKAAAAAGKAEAARADLEPLRVAAERALEAAESRLGEANRRGEAERVAWQAARRGRERAALVAEVRALGDRLGRAEAVHREIGEARRTLAADPVDEKSLGELRRLSEERARLRAALDAAAVVLSFAPEEGRAVSRGGETVDAGGSVRVTERTTFRLDGFGEVEVTPGGQDVPRLRIDLDDAERRWNAELGKLQVGDLAAAEAAMARKRALNSRVEGLNGRLKGEAPEGLDALRALVRQKREDMAADEAGGGEAPDVEAARAAERAAEDAHDRATRAAADAVSARDVARESFHGVQQRWLEAGADLEQRKEMSAGLRMQLEREREAETDEALAARAENADATLQRRRVEHDMAQAEYEASDPEAVGLERERTREVHERLRAAIDADRRAERDLAVELRTLGQRGLAEDLERCRGERDAACRDLARTEADAKAWKLLLDTLRDNERTAKETFVEPVSTRLQPYLRMVFPETGLTLDGDDLEIARLRRGEFEEPFESLSVGAREQVAVLTRLALADLLRDKGRPVALIFDDPLVNTDDPRFGRMLLALRKAAAALQIVVLTWNEARYEALGARTIRLADCAVAG